MITERKRHEQDHTSPAYPARKANIANLAMNMCKGGSSKKLAVASGVRGHKSMLQADQDLKLQNVLPVMPRRRVFQFLFMKGSDLRAL